MKITTVKIREMYNLDRLIAIVSITIDNSLAINDIKVINNGKKIFIDFPNNSNGKPIIAPLNKKTRKYIEYKIISKLGHNVPTLINRSEDI